MEPMPTALGAQTPSHGLPGKSLDNFYQYISLSVFPTGIRFDKYNQTSYRQNSRFILFGVSLLKVFLSWPAPCAIRHTLCRIGWRTSYLSYWRRLKTAGALEITQGQISLLSVFRLSCHYCQYSPAGFQSLASRRPDIPPGAETQL